MENKIQIFQNDDFGEIRVIEIDGQPWFVGKDVAGVLGYERPTKAIQDHIDDDDKDVVPIQDSIRRMQKTPIISESGLYSLILSSKLPSAKAFKRWVTSEVLPSIRKRGAYITDETLDKILQNHEYSDWLIQELQAERIKSSFMLGQISMLEPKARYYDIILQSSNAVPISLIAKDYGLSAVRFNKMLNLMKIQYKLRDSWLLYQPYAMCGYTISHTYPINEEKSVMHTYWTQKGRFFIYELLKSVGIVPVCERGGAYAGTD